MNNKRFECETCGRVFTRSTSLTEHKYIHSNSKPFECINCHKTFRQISNYNKHRKLHEEHSEANPNSLECRVCGRLFATQSYLKSHLLSHNDFKSCLCHKCGNTFKYRCDLIRHMKIHDNQRQYKCNVCPFAFNDISALKRHRIKVHKIIGKSVGNCGVIEDSLGSKQYESNNGLNEKCDKIEISSKTANQSLDLNDSNYLNSVIDYIDVCRILPVPLPDHIFEKLVDIMKDITIHLGIDNKCKKQFYSILRTGLQDLNSIIGEHLELKYKINQ